MAIKKNKIEPTTLDFGKTQVLISSRKNVIDRKRKIDNEAEILEVKERRMRNREFYRLLLERDDNLHEAFNDNYFYYQKFERRLNSLLKDLYFDVKKYAITKFLEFVEHYRLSISNVRAFHFIIFNNKNFDSWFENISGYHLIEKSTSLFATYIEKVSSERGFDVSYEWLAMARKSFREFLKIKYMPKVREIYISDWNKVRTNYYKYLSNNKFDQFKFKD